MAYTNEQLILIKKFKSYLAKRGYKFQSNTVHLLSTTLRAEVSGRANKEHFNFVKYNFSNSVVDLYFNQSSDFKIISFKFVFVNFYSYLYIVVSEMAKVR